jgi:ribosomal protein L37AE/L43A
MKNHVLRPFMVVLVIVAVVLVARSVLVPADFGTHERGYMYGWHRKANEQEWKDVQVRYKTSATCPQCHPDKYADLSNSPHGIISCENCHGPALEHPRDPVGYSIDRSRTLCIRCHAKLPYGNTPRGRIPGIDPDRHYTQAECVMCHIPHNPKPVNQKRRVQS